MGYATLPTPENIANKTLKLDFVDMAELCPEPWLFESETQEKLLPPLFKKRKQPGTDILTWTQCFAPYTAVLGGKVPRVYPTPHGLRTCRLLLAVITSLKATGGLSTTHHIGAGQPSKIP